jgi:hypothetical protein
MMRTKTFEALLDQVRKLAPAERAELLRVLSIEEDSEARRSAPAREKVPASAQRNSDSVSRSKRQPAPPEVRLYGMDSQGYTFPAAVVAAHLVASSPRMAWLDEVRAQVEEAIRLHRGTERSEEMPGGDMAQASTMLNLRLFPADLEGEPMPPEAVRWHLLGSSVDRQWLERVKEGIDLPG